MTPSPSPRRMSSVAGIASAGVALPALRLARESRRDAWGVASRSVERSATIAFDEDEVTLAVAAARRAIAAAGASSEDVGLVAFSTAGSAQGASVVAEAVGASNARLVDAAGRRTAGLASLVTAFDTVRAVGNVVLVVAADVPRAPPGTPEEAEEGGAAAAFVVAPDGAVRLAAAGAAAHDRPGGDAAGPSDRGLVARAIDADRVAFEAPASFIVRQGDADVTWATGPKPHASLRSRIGDAGAALPLVDLAVALARAPPGSSGLVVADDGGQALALRLSVATAFPRPSPDPEALAAGGRSVSYLESLRERGAFVPGAAFPDEPMGAFVSWPDFARSLPARYRLEAARCGACGRTSFPPRASCPRCSGASWQPVPLSGRGKVWSFTTIARGSGPSEFAVEQAMTGDYVSAIVELEEGPRVAARLADVPPGGIAIGFPVRAELRRLYSQQGTVRYGFKFVPE